MSYGFAGYGYYKAKASSVSSHATLLFDASDPKTMTFPKDVSVRWSKTTLTMAKSTRFGVVTVYDNHGDATGVLLESKRQLAKMLPSTNGSWSPVSHCAWCGQKLDYVALIVGIDPATKTASVHHIGCDCVGKIFGVSWYGYRSADSAKKKLMEAAKVRRRSEEYPIKYATQLKWLDAVPEFLLSKSTFLTDMRRIMRTGERPVSKKMEKLPLVTYDSQGVRPEVIRAGESKY